MPCMTSFTPAMLAMAVLGACAAPTDPGQDVRGAPASAPLTAIVAQTRLGIDGGRFTLNGAVTYSGKAAEGRLMNVRMVNSVFEDVTRTDFDPSANTEEFVGRMR